MSTINFSEHLQRKFPAAWTYEQVPNTGQLIAWHQEAVASANVKGQSDEEVERLAATELTRWKSLCEHVPRSGNDLLAMAAYLAEVAPQRGDIDPDSLCTALASIHQSLSTWISNSLHSPQISDLDRFAVTLFHAQKKLNEAVDAFEIVHQQMKPTAEEEVDF